MKRTKTIAKLLLMGIGLCVSAKNADAQVSTPANNSAGEFIKNMGQITSPNGTLHPEVLFAGRSGNAELFLTNNSISYVYARRHAPPTPSRLIDTTIKDTLVRVDLSFLGTNPNAQIIPQSQTAGSLNYLIGTSSVTNVSAFQQVTYKNLWNNIDLVLSNNGGIVYNFILNNGANPNDIQFTFNGATGVSLNADGITATTPLGNAIHLPLPVSIDILGLTIPTTYLQIGTAFGIDRRGARVSGFSIGGLVSYCPFCSFSSTNTSWVTYYGGTSDDQINDSYTDASGNLYEVGSTQSDATTFPQKGGLYTTLSNTQSVFVSQFNSAHQRTYSTYIGGGTGSFDYGNAIAVNTNGDIYVGGVAGSPTFPVPTGVYPHHFGYRSFYAQDGFVLRLTTSGTVMDWGTFTAQQGGGQVSSLALDHAGHLIAAGYAQAPDMGVTSPYIDMGGGAFIQKIIYDPSGCCFTSDGLIMKMDLSTTLPTINLLTYFGGSASDFISSVAVDASNNVFVTGGTESPDALYTSTGYTSGHQIPMLQETATSYNHANNGGRDAFIAKFDANGILKWSTEFGGSGDDFAEKPGSSLLGNDNYSGKVMAISPVNNDVYIVGGTASGSDFLNQAPPAGATLGFDKPNNAGGNDGFITQFSNTGDVKWSTHMGGNATDEADAVIIDASGTVYITGYTSSVNFPTKANQLDYYQAANLGGYDGFFTRFDASGSQIHGTYFGGSSNDISKTIYQSASDNVIYLAGFTNTTNRNVTAVPPVLWGFPVKANSGAYNQDIKTTTDNDGFIASFTTTRICPQCPAFRKGAFDASKPKQGIATEKSVTVFPNPGHDNVTLSIQGMEQQDVQINIYNTLGQLVYVKKLNSISNIENHELSVSGLSKGLYLIKVNAGEESYKQQLVIE